MQMWDIRNVAVDVARGLRDLHAAGFVSGGMKSKNIAVFREVWKIIDLDNARRFGQKMAQKVLVM